MKFHKIKEKEYLYYVFNNEYTYRMGVSVYGGKVQVFSFLENDKETLPSDEISLNEVPRGILRKMIEMILGDKFKYIFKHIR